MAKESLIRFESMEVAMIEVCEHNDVDLNALKKMAFVPHFEPSPEFVNQAIVDEYTQRFNGLIR